MNVIFITETACVICKKGDKCNFYKSQAKNFNENDVELKTEDQKIKIVNFAVNTDVFSGNINCFERIKPILGLYDKASR